MPMPTIGNEQCPSDLGCHCFRLAVLPPQPREDYMLVAVCAYCLTTYHAFWQNGGWQWKRAGEPPELKS